MDKSTLEKFLRKGNIIESALGDIELVKRIGTGGNGIVFEGILHKDLIAIKFLHSDKKGDSLNEQIIRFKAEYYNLIKIPSNSYTAQYIGFETLVLDEFEYPYILMKRYESSMKGKKCNSAEDALYLFNFLLDSIEFIHSNNIIHRDLKPENILFEMGICYLCDFGIAAYNPEMFNLKAETKKDTRLGNRLFSAPEQERSNIPAVETMDIYAMGQILQWFITGKIHRGTGRKRVNSIFKELAIIDSIIEICLKEDPAERFQNIPEIRNYYKDSTTYNIKAQHERLIFNSLGVFNDVLRSCFPENDSYIVHSNDKERIKDLIKTLDDNKALWKNNLRLINYLGEININFDYIEKYGWLISNYQYKITDIWIHYNYSLYNDFIILRYAKDEDPFIINNEETYAACIVDQKHLISNTEYENRRTIIDGKKIELIHGVNAIPIYKENKSGYLLICLVWHCGKSYQNLSIIQDYFSELNSGKVNIENTMGDFITNLRQHIHPLVLESL